jgi:RNA polymerase sigma factor (sigma-70 family)
VTDVIKVMRGENSTSDMNAARFERVDRAPEDAQRFTRLYRRHHSDVRGFARRRVGVDAADEIVADTFLVAWRRIDDIPDPAVPWLYRVALYEIANLRRRQVKQVRLGHALGRGSALAEMDQETDASDLLNAVARAFGSLKERDQEILRLAAWEQVTMAEGAAVLGCSVSAFRMRLHRARARLAAKSGASDFVRERRPDAPESTITLVRAIARSPRPIEGTELAL